MRSNADRVTDIYQRHAHAWSLDRGDNMLETAWLDRFLALLPNNPTVLDLGCGTGAPIAIYLAEHGCRITGVDASTAMITMSARRLPEHQWHVADMRSVALNRRFDGIIAWDSFFHLTQADQRGMFAVFNNHAAPGAALMFTSGPSAGEQIGTYRGEPLYHASLDTAEYRELLQDNGFDLVNHIVEDPSCGHHTIWLARLRVRTGPR
ncbi:dTDP-3-amino-3,4, 6-trideoxy-alpha-D-glucopyranose [Mycobacterium simulans]|uniref:dTDP-3-amino-3,4, 6-trideoxy-alpha-D-glucopyranose n=1 Tax=Mycobacterium simulans TaxID=627089 RepID=A0A7Z7INR7_9MYCO|nr:class I SAM-dependent methyltransferase [Mycobacterium simulans]SOJ56026.1 dTDP-3-amino-3,4, 6-trideoxy-alpha-D-glucopyranose [Mycobacterium simulans]